MKHRTTGGLYQSLTAAANDQLMAVEDLKTIPGLPSKTVDTIIKEKDRVSATLAEDDEVGGKFPVYMALSLLIC
ncbi:Hypp466 [Branchiostoma lanceolatum]|uniref:Hypp466 protein n=1 Tax=Branchiostoma lanceolatum TaxID=7740 RepID=A0A8J9VBF6_BRALA|nr:Hypp466 [Branchiostoma lanceolatum]